MKGEIESLGLVFIWQRRKRKIIKVHMLLGARSSVVG
jgi:hypothetical protein